MLPDLLGFFVAVVFAEPSGCAAGTAWEEGKLTDMMKPVFLVSFLDRPALCCVRAKPRNRIPRQAPDDLSRSLLVRRSWQHYDARRSAGSLPDWSIFDRVMQRFGTKAAELDRAAVFRQRSDIRPAATRPSVADDAWLPG